MTPAYLVVEAKVSDPAAYERYKGLADLAIRAYGGKFLVRGGKTEVLEGPWKSPERMVILAFESAEQAKKFYDSPEYLAARKAREAAAEFNMLLVEGL